MTDQILGYFKPTWVEGRPNRYLMKRSLVRMKERRMVRKVPKMRITGKVLQKMKYPQIYKRTTGKVS